MKLTPPWRTRFTTAAALTLAAVSAAACSSTSTTGSGGSAAASAGELTTVKIGGSTGGDLGLAWIAQQAGFFKQQGINADFVNFVGSGTPAITSAFLGGSFDFLNGPVATTMSAKAAGAPIQAVFNVDIGQQLEIAIHNSVASQLHIPAATGTSSGALAQLMALKGSHLKLAVTSTTSPAWNAVVAIAKTHGLTAGVNAAGDDIDIVTTGTTTAMNASYLADKVQAMASNPPTTTKPDSTNINLGLITPLSDATGIYLDVLQSFAQKNAQTTQKVVNAMVQAWAYAKKYPQKAEQLTVSMQKQNDITDTSEDQSLYQDAASHWETPLLTMSGFSNAVKIVNLAQPQKLTLTYEQWADPSFVNQAVKDLAPVRADSPSS